MGSSITIHCDYSTDFENMLYWLAMSENDKVKRKKEEDNNEPNFDKVMKALLSVSPKENEEIKKKVKKERNKKEDK